VVATYLASLGDEIEGGRKMKTIVAKAITAAALVSGCSNTVSGHAIDPTEAFLEAVHANMKAAGIRLPAGVPQAIFDQGLLIGGHRMCDLAARGRSPNEILTSMHPDPGAEAYTMRNIDAAETHLCPQYKH
jgi:uncharacterized protein DUF732